MAVTHLKVSSVPDGSDASLVQPSDWNASHVGAVEVASGTVDFGTASDIAEVSVSASWVTSSSIIICCPSGSATADHDAEDYLLEGITANAVSLVDGVGFTIRAHAPNGTFGQYKINAMGI